jgi:hypothetical protein
MNINYIAGLTTDISKQVENVILHSKSAVVDLTK